VHYTGLWCGKLVARSDDQEVGRLSVKYLYYALLRLHSVARDAAGVLSPV
jgi:hypothetical protein